MAEKKFKGKVEIDLGDLGKARAEIQKLQEELELKRAPEKIAALRSELDGLKAGSKEAATTLKDGFKAAFTTIAAGFTAIRIKSFMDSAVKDFNKLETTLLGLQATARLTGNNFDKLKKSVTDLSKDGVLSLDQATTSMKTLLAQGIKADKAFELLNAAKKVSAFNNIVGNTGQGVADFVKFLQTGSAELAENMDPSIVKVVKSLGGYEKVASDAAAKQELINEVIKKGANLTAEYNEYMESGTQAQVNFDSAATAFSQTLGSKLEPAYTSVLSVGAQFINFLSEGLNKLSTSTVVLGVAALAIGAFGRAAMVAGARFGLMWAAMLGPIAIAIAAVTALSALFVQVFAKPKNEDIIKSYRNVKSEVSQLGEKIKELNSIRNRSVSQEIEFRNSLEKLRDKLKAAGVDYDDLAAKAKNLNEVLSLGQSALRTRAAEQVQNNLRDTETAIRHQEEAIRSVEQRAQRRGTAISAGTPTTTNFDSPFGVLTVAGYGTYEGARQRLEELRNRRDRQQLEYADTLNQEADQAPRSSAGASGTPKAEFRFIEARDQLKKLKEEYDAYIKIVGKDSAKGKEASEKFGFNKESVLSGLRQSQAEYLENQYAAEKENIDRAYEEQIANVRELANAGAIKGEEVENQLNKIRKQNIINNANLQLKAFKDTLSGANDILNAIQGAKGGDAGKGISAFGGGLQGLAKASKGFSSLTGVTDIFGKSGPIGEVIAVGGQLISGIMSVFGEDEAERARQQAERDAMALKVMQSQEQLARQLLDFQKSQAEVPFKQLQTKMRLIDLQANQKKIGASDSQLSAIEKETIQKKLAAVSEVLKNESSSFTGGQFFTDVVATSEGLSAALSQTTGYAAGLALLQNIVNDVAATRGGNAEEIGFDFYNTRLNTIAGLNLPPQLKSAATDFISSVAAQGFFKRASASGINTDNDVELAKIGYRNRYGAQLFGIAKGYEASLGGRGINTSTTAVDTLTGELAADTTRLESLFGLIEQQTGLNQQIADNTKRTADNTDIPSNNALSFVNIGKGFTQSLGMINAPVNQQALNLPSGLGTIALASQRLNEVNDSTLSRLDKQIELQKIMVGLLGAVAAKEIGIGGADIDLIRQTILNILEDSQYRKVA